MKLIARNSLVSLMVLLTLAAGGGFTLSRMICSGSGNTSYEIGQMQKCGSDSDHEHQCIGNTCCQMNSSELKTDEHTSTVKPNTSDEPIQVVGIPFLTPIDSQSEDAQSDEPSSFDPPDLGITILRLLTILLI